MSKNEVGGLIGQKLQAALNDLKRGSKLIQGSLKIAPGHDYWWFLEYGTGAHFGEKGEPDGTLAPPASTQGEVPERARYEIVVKEQKFLVYLTKAGVRNRRAATFHPGIVPLGFVRTAIFDAQLYIQQDIEGLQQQHRLFTRAELTEVVNETLRFLLKQVQAYSPSDHDEDPYHDDTRPRTPPLHEAWSIREAK